MKRKITYKQRLFYVLITGGLFILVLYNIAISDTIVLIVENNELETQILNNRNAPSQVELIKQKLNKIKQVIGNDNYEETDIHQMLLQLITDKVQKNNLILKDFPQPYVISDKGYVTKTVKATIEGDFTHLLKLVYFLEHNYKGGKVVAVDFKTTKELRTRKRKLNTIIYLQNVKAENHEENS